ncbi:MAG: ACP S-malonyltransferase [Acidobacteriota bacterium]
MGYALLFPGQGSQSVGMAKDFVDAHPRARETFEEADDALGFKLSTLCFEGPDEELKLTANTQPAILAASIAVFRVVDAAASGLAPVAVAGHSLGEYSAHVAAGCLAFADALRLVRRRGELMQEAVPVGTGAMAAVIGLDEEPLRALVESVSAEGDGIVTVANLNSPGQIVIAGHRGAVERAADRAKGEGARMAKMLPVSAPFHSPLMAPARHGLQPMLDETEFHDPNPQVVVNIDAAPVTAGPDARDALARQIDGPVRWIESIQAMRGDAVGAQVFAEIGPGKVLTGLGKRIDRSATWLPSPGAADLDAFLEKLTA